MHVYRLVYRYVYRRAYIYVSGHVSMCIEMCYAGCPVHGDRPGLHAFDERFKLCQIHWVAWLVLLIELATDRPVRISKYLGESFPTVCSNMHVRMSLRMSVHMAMRCPYR